VFVVCVCVVCVECGVWCGCGMCVVCVVCGVWCVCVVCGLCGVWFVWCVCFYVSTSRCETVTFLTESIVDNIQTGAA
jgi:hypothetical protein